MAGGDKRRQIHARPRHARRTEQLGQAFWRRDQRIGQTSEVRVRLHSPKLNSIVAIRRFHSLTQRKMFFLTVKSDIRIYQGLTKGFVVSE